MHTLQAFLTRRICISDAVPRNWKKESHVCFPMPFRRQVEQLMLCRQRLQLTAQDEAAAGGAADSLLYSLGGINVYVGPSFGAIEAVRQSALSRK